MNLYFIYILQNVIFVLSMYTQTFDKGYAEISKELKDEIQALYASSQGHIGNPVIININTDTISADQDHSITLKLPYKSGDLGTDIMELLYVKKEGELFSIKNYNITYLLNEENVIHTIYPNMFPDDIEDTVENDVDCTYTISDNLYYLEYKSFPPLKKVIFYSYVILGLEVDTKRIKRIGYRDSALYQSDITSRIFHGNEFFQNDQNTIFINLYKIEQLFDNIGYIVFLVKYKSIQNKWDFLLLFYKIFLISEGFYLDLEKVLNIQNLYDIKNEEINDSNIDTLINIERVGCFKDYFFILFINRNKNNDIFIVQSSVNVSINIKEASEELGNNLKNKNIIDFIIFRNILCLLIENEGLILYTIKPDFIEHKLRFEYNSNFTFKYGKKLEIYRNPFYGAVFIGIFFHNNIKEKKSHEIYMELLIYDFHKNDYKSNYTLPISLRINKIVTASNKRNFKFLQFMDNFYNYFYDDERKELFIYRIGLLNTIPYVTYKLRLTRNSTNSKIMKDVNITNLVPIFNKNEGKFNTLLIGSVHYIVLNNLTLASHNLNCTFHSDGNFNLTFILKGEVCAHSLIKASKKNYVSCHKIIKYNFHVYGKDKEKFGMFLIILFCIIIISTFFFTCLSINTNCFKNYRSIENRYINKSFYTSQTQNALSSGESSINNLSKYHRYKKEKIKYN